jgi:hypothetical protein
LLVLQHLLYFDISGQFIYTAKFSRFSRYRAVSRPIQYSRQAQNVRRVTLIIVVIWLISLALASPMVFGIKSVFFLSLIRIIIPK